MDNRRQIVLTEEDLHILVENAVKSYLINEGLNEDFLGGLKSLGGWFGKNAANAGKSAANAVGNKMNQAGQAIGNKMNQAGQAIGNAYNSAANAVGNKVNQAGQAIGNAYNSAKGAVGNAYNSAANAVGSAANAVGNKMNQAGQAIGNAYNSAKGAYQQGSAQGDLQNVNSSLQSMVQKGIIAQGVYNQILRMLNKAMKQQGGAAMAGMPVESIVRRAVNASINEMRRRRNYRRVY